MLTILGNKVVPWLAERYLARTGYDAQRADEPVDPDRLDYLFEPVSGDGGAHGKSDDQAGEDDPQLRAMKNRGLPALASAGFAGAAYIPWRG